MAKSLLIFDRPVPVTAARHGRYAVRPVGDYRFAAHLTAIPVLLAELHRVAAECPVVVTREPRPMLVALTGIAPGQNLRVGADGRWIGRYVPAFLRQYPFAVGTAPASRHIVCIDEAYGGLNAAEAGGVRLFEDGEPSAYLNRQRAFVGGVLREVRRTSEFCARLVALDLLEASEARFTAAGRPAKLQGFDAVSRAALRSLAAGERDALATGDGLEAIYTHLASLAQFTPLAEMFEAARTPPPAPGARLH